MTENNSTALRFSRRIRFTYIWQVVMALLAVLSIVVAFVMIASGMNLALIVSLFLSALTFGVHCFIGYKWRVTERSRAVVAGVR